MASKGKKIIKMVGEQEEELSEDNSDRAMEEAVRDFAEGDHIVKLYRYVGEMGGRPRFLGGLAREDFNEVFVQDRFGGGRYFGRWRKKDGAYTRFTFEIEGEPKVFTVAQEKAAEQREREAQPEGSAYRYGGGGEEEEPQAQPSGAMTTAEVLRVIADTRREAREEMRLFFEMMRPAAQPPNATEQVFSLVKELLPMIQGAGGGEGSSGNVMVDALIRLKDPIMKALETAQIALTKAPAQPAQPAQPVQPAPVAPVVRQGNSLTPPASASPEPQQPTVEVLSEGEMLAESFRSYLPMMIGAATAGKDPSLYCDLILDQVPGFAYDRLRTWLLKPGCLDDLAKYEPIIAQDHNQRLWWEALRAMLVAALNEELGNGDTNIQPESNSDAPAPSSTPRA